MVAVHDGDLGDVGGGIGRHGAVLDGQLRLEGPLEVAVVHLHGPHHRHLGRCGVGLHAEALRADVGVQADGAAAGLGQGVAVGERRGAVLPGDLAAHEHQAGAYVLQVLEQHQVRQAGGRDGADQVVEAVGAGRVERGHPVGLDGLHAAVDGGAHVVVDVALAGKVAHVAVIGAERELVEPAGDPARIGEQRPHVVVHGARHDGDADAQAQPLDHLVGLEGVVVVEDAGGGVAPQRLGGDAGAVAGDAPPGCERPVRLAGRRFLQIEGVALTERHGERVAEPRQDLALGHRAAAEFEFGGAGHLVGDLPEDAQRGSGGAGDVHSHRSKHVGQAVGVGQHRGGAPRHHQPGQFARCEQRVLDVQVRVDEPRRHPAAGGVDLAARGQASGRRDGGDVRAADQHVATQHLPPVQRQHGAVAHRQVGGFGAGGHPLQAQQLPR